MLLDICTMLDPRVKLTPYLNEPNKGRLHDEVCRRMDNYNYNNSPPQAAQDQDSHTDIGDIAIEKPKHGLASLLGESYEGSVRRLLCKDQMIKAELRAYLADAPCNMSESPLQW